jgi:hypothetical protein
MAGNIFQDGMNAFLQTNAAIGSIQRKRADYQAAPKIAAGDFGGAAQAYGQAGMADDARQAVVDQQVMGNRAVAAQDKAKAEQAAEAQRKADGLLHVVDALGATPQGQRLGKLHSLMPAIQSLGIDTTAFGQLDEAHLSDQELASFKALVGKAVSDYNLGNVRYSGATNKPIAGFMEVDPAKTVYGVGDGPAGAPGAAPQPAQAPAAGVTPSGYTATSKDRDALARMMVTEAGGEGPLGMVAVGQVAMNRVKSGYGGAKSIADVVNAPGQFEGMKNAASVDPATYQKALVLADHVLQGQAPDPTNGAVQFLNPDLQAQLGRQQPAWANGNGQRIGRHVFYGGGKQAAGGAGLGAGQDTLQGGAGADTQPPQIPGMHVLSAGQPKVVWRSDGKGNLINDNGDRKVDPTVAGAGGTPTGDTSLTGDAYLKGLPTARAAQINAMLSGRLAYPSAFALKTPYWQSMLADAAQVDPTFDATKFATRSATRTAFVKGTQGQNITSINTLLNHLGELQAASDKMDNTAYPWLNAALTPGRIAAGDANYGALVDKYDAAAKAVASEAVRTLRGASGASGDVKHWLDQLGHNKPRAGRDATIQEIVQLIGGRYQPLQAQYQAAMGPEADPLVELYPKAAAIYKKLGGDVPESSAPAAAASPAAASSGGWGKATVVRH